MKTPLSPRASLIAALALAVTARGQISRAVLDEFTAPGVPARGPAEVETARDWPELPPMMPSWPGTGLAQHSFLIGGEGYNQLQLVRDGKVAWTYGTGKGGEIDDGWMLSNGHVLFTAQHHLYEVTPDKKVVWQYDCPTGTECHAVQPIGVDKVLFMQNGLPAKVILLNKKTNAVEMEHVLTDLNSTDPKTVHPQVRHLRLTPAGTYLVPYLKLGKVVEYDKDWKEVLSIAAVSPWAAVRLKNGNILINGDSAGWLREVNRKGETVWEIERDELPGIILHTVQTAERLSNGNTLICSCGTGSKKDGPPNYQTSVQVVEVTPDKKIVWVVQDWARLGPCSWIQLLDEPGVPENGDLLR